MLDISGYSLNIRLHLLLSVESQCIVSVMLISVDGVPAILCGRGDDSAGAAREEARGLSGPRACLLPAAQVPDPEPAVCSADG